MSDWLRKRQKTAITGPIMTTVSAKNDRKTVGRNLEAKKVSVDKVFGKEKNR